MGSLQILKSSFSSPFSVSHSNSGLKLCWDFNSQSQPSCSRKTISFRSYRSFRVACKLQGDDNQSSREERPESLFMKELKRRGMTPTSLLEESNRSIYGDEETKFKEEEGGYSKRKSVTTDYGKSLSNQRERSMALNSEGPEGLIPRAKLILSLGGTFFSAFWLLILLTVASFLALYLFLGPAFVHDASTRLEDERVYQSATRLN